LRLRGTIVAPLGTRDLLFVGTPTFATAEELALSGLVEIDFAPGDPTFDLFEQIAHARRAEPSLPEAPAGLVDAVQLQRLAGIPGKTEATLAADLLAVFSTRFAGAVSQIRDAAARADVDGVREAAHALKGSALTVGAAAIGEHCESIESKARAGDISDVAHHCAEVERLWPETEPYLRELVG